MIELILMLNLAGLTSNAPLAANQIQPCVWPNRCSQEILQLDQVQPCVWPNRCGSV